MEVGKVIKTQLSAAGINCYPEVAPQSVTGDSVVYSVVSNIPLTSKGNTSHVDSFRVQCDSYSSTYSGAVLLASYVRTALDGKNGSIGGLTVDHIKFSNELAGYQLDPNNYVVTQDYIIRIKL